MKIWGHQKAIISSIFLILSKVSWQIISLRIPAYKFSLIKVILSKKLKAKVTFCKILWCIMSVDWKKKNPPKTLIQPGKEIVEVVRNRNCRYKKQLPTFYLYFRNFTIYKKNVIIVSFIMACGSILACGSIFCQNLNIWVIS